MLQVQNKRTVRFMVVDKPTTVMLVALLIELRSDNTEVVIKQRVVKVIEKNAFSALPGKVLDAGKNAILLLGAALSKTLKKIAFHNIYNSSIFGYSHSHIITWLGAQPPTLAL